MNGIRRSATRRRTCRTVTPRCAATSSIERRTGNAWTVAVAVGAISVVMGIESEPVMSRITTRITTRVDAGRREPSHPAESRGRAAQSRAVPSAATLLLAFETPTFGPRQTDGRDRNARRRSGVHRMAGERVLELGDALLKAHDLLPQPISLGRDRNDAFSHLRDVVLPAQSFTALSLDGTVSAHALSVGSPLTRPTGTVLSHAPHFRTFVYPSTHSHICTSGSCTHRDCPRRTSRISTRTWSKPGQSPRRIERI
jgi:hypothetical protein